MGKRILIIEDELPLAEEWALALVASGYETKIVTKISEALSIIDQLEFDLVLLDVMLPTIEPTKGISVINIAHGRVAGVYIAQKIKKKKPSLPIIAVTVVSDKHILEQLKQAGVARILRKSRASIKDIQAAIKSFL